MKKTYNFVLNGISHMCFNLVTEMYVIPNYEMTVSTYPGKEDSYGTVDNFSAEITNWRQ